MESPIQLGGLMANLHPALVTKESISETSSKHQGDNRPYELFVVASQRLTINLHRRLNAERELIEFHRKTSMPNLLAAYWPR